jgi:hypothetical protein
VSFRNIFVGFGTLVPFGTSEARPYTGMKSHALVSLSGSSILSLGQLISIILTSVPVVPVSLCCCLAVVCWILGYFNYRMSYYLLVPPVGTIGLTLLRKTLLFKMCPLMSLLLICYLYDLAWL